MRRATTATSACGRAHRTRGPLIPHDLRWLRPLLCGAAAVHVGVCRDQAARLPAARDPPVRTSRVRAGRRAGVGASPGAEEPSQHVGRSARSGRCSSTRRTSARRRRWRAARRATRAAYRATPRTRCRRRRRPSRSSRSRRCRRCSTIRRSTGRRSAPSCRRRRPTAATRHRHRRRRPSPRARRPPASDRHRCRRRRRRRPRHHVSGAGWRRRPRPRRCRRPSSSRRRNRNLAAAAQAAATFSPPPTPPPPVLEPSPCPGCRRSRRRRRRTRRRAAASATCPTAARTPSARSGRPTSAAPKRGLAMVVRRRESAVAVRPSLLPQRRRRLRPEAVARRVAAAGEAVAEPCIPYDKCFDDPAHGCDAEETMQKNCGTPFLARPPGRSTLGRARVDPVRRRCQRALRVRPRQKGQHNGVPNENFWDTHTVPCADFTTKEKCEELAPSYNGDFCVWSGVAFRDVCPMTCGDCCEAPPSPPPLSPPPSSPPPSSPPPSRRRRARRRRRRLSSNRRRRSRSPACLSRAPTRQTTCASRSQLLREG